MFISSISPIEAHKVSINNVLSTEECAQYNQMISCKRKIEFLDTRVKIKRLIQGIKDDSSMDIDVCKRELGAPYTTINCENNRKYIQNLNISHSNNYSFLIISTVDEFIGNDIETIRSKSIPVNYSEIEKKKMKKFDNQKLTECILFSVKEALGKSLGIGLLSPYELYELADFETVVDDETEYFISKFKFFPYLVGYTLKIATTDVASVVVSRKKEFVKVKSLFMNIKLQTSNNSTSYQSSK